MEKIEKLFKNPGQKIKILACILFAVAVVISVICGFVFLIVGRVRFLIAICCIALGIIGAYISALLLYGYGELISKTSKNEKNTSEILKDVESIEKNEGVAKEVYISKNQPKEKERVDTLIESEEKRLIELSKTDIEISSSFTATKKLYYTYGRITKDQYLSLLKNIK